MSPVDDRVEPPSQPPTVEMPSVPQWAIDMTRAMQAGFRETNANIELVTGDVRSLKGDVRGLQEWRLTIEARTPMTTERIREAVDDHPSRVDLAHEARLAEEIVKGHERDKTIAATHALALSAAGELARQSRAMGIGLQGLKWLASKDGANTMLRIATLAGVIYATLKTSGVLK